MNVHNKNRIIPVVIISIVSVAVILVVSTVFIGRQASKDTSSAVRSVSLLYLDELANRREQVVETSLDKYMKELDTVVDSLDSGDLASFDSLRQYQASMEQVYGLDRIAFVDSQGMIYTSKGTRTDIDEYSFDYNDVDDGTVFIKDINSSSKKTVLANPVDNLQVEDKVIVACFIEVDMDELLEGISMEANDNSSTFCNVYTTEGIPLANGVFGSLSKENNLITAMEQAEYEDNGNFKEWKKDFQNKNEGVISFSYNDVQVTLYYMPVTGTDWMLTSLIRESVINEKITDISNSIIERSLIQSVATALVLIAMFVFMVIQLRKASRLTVEKEVSDAENRIKQQELEEQLAMQEELLEQEKRQAEQDKMITALSSDYRSVYYVNIDTDECVCYRNVDNEYDGIVEGDKFSFIEKMTWYIETFVDEAYKENFYKFIDADNIREGLSKEVILTYRYLIHRDGTDCYEMFRMAGVRHIEDRTDNMVHAIGVGFTDIDTEMKESLETRHALSEALQTAEEASKAKTVFLSNMSHEIRTPMNAIIGLDSLALSDPDISDKTREYLEKIDNSAKHLLGLINDILDMSRIESGRMVLKNEEFAFAKLIEQVNTIIGSQCDDKNIHYNCVVNGEVADYYIGDDIKLRQVLINILGNSVKFTPEGGNVDLIVERTAGYEGKSTLRFEMKDTGIGMSKDYLPKIFETFSQEDPMAANKYGSSGLGMAITKNFVEMMNGRIDVDSEKGKGTTFTVTVTLLDSERKDAGADENVDVNTSEMSVLIVDDDKIAAEHAALVLGNVGISTEVALSGEEAINMVKLRHARSEPYNLIVVDWQMPEMDGVETTKAIRSEVGDESAIIILTAYNWDDILEEAEEAGVDSFISKPLFPGSVIDEFKKAFKKKKVVLEEKHSRDNLKGCKILLAEDIDINAQIMTQILMMGDMETEHAENGKIAVDMFESKPEGYYDAILMDMRMPEMDGLEATKAIRALDRSDAKTIPIIALTANAFDEDVQRSMQAGLDAHLSKPVDPNILYETLINYIK